MPSRKNRPDKSGTGICSNDEKRIMGFYQFAGDEISKHSVLWTQTRMVAEGAPDDMVRLVDTLLHLEYAVPTPLPDNLMSVAKGLVTKGFLRKVIDLPPHRLEGDFVTVFLPTELGLRYLLETKKPAVGEEKPKAKRAKKAS